MTPVRANVARSANYSRRLNRYRCNYLGRCKHPCDQGGTDHGAKIDFTGKLKQPGGKGNHQNEYPNDMEKVDDKGNKHATRSHQWNEPADEQGQVLYRQEKQERENHDHDIGRRPVKKGLHGRGPYRRSHLTVKKQTGLKKTQQKKREV